MAVEHRVAGHLGVAADEYDRAIRRFIPNYDRMVATVVDWLDGHVPAGGVVVDLGAGTGALSAAILDALPEVQVELVDIDPNMLDAAEVRCAAHAGRFHLRKGRFQDALPRCHAVVATLALHHVSDHGEKLDLYRGIRAALERGGLVVVGDMLVYPDGLERARMLQDWYRHMEGNGITAEQADAHFAQWAEEDRYLPLPEELALIAEAGFPRPECFWREGGLAVYGAFKDDPPEQSPPRILIAD
jgi:tRNA (cmo5U34)-methyltransferase